MHTTKLNYSLASEGMVKEFKFQVGEFVRRVAEGNEFEVSAEGNCNDDTVKGTVAAVLCSNIAGLDATDDGKRKNHTVSILTSSQYSKKASAMSLVSSSSASSEHQFYSQHHSLA